MSRSSPDHVRNRPEVAPVQPSVVSFLDLAVVCTAALVGPLLATPRRWHLTVVLGELLARAPAGPPASRR